jgi:hypothetical protein
MKRVGEKEMLMIDFHDHPDSVHQLLGRIVPRPEALPRPPIR